MEMAQATELADKHAKTLSGSSEVHHIPQKPRKPPSYTISQTKPQGQPRDCYRCGGKHVPWDYRFKDQSCRYCKKLGHIARVCHKKAQQQKMRPDKKPTNKVELSEDLDDSQKLHHVEGKRRSQPPYIVSVSLDGRSTQMEVDTGATLSLMSETTYRKLWKVPPKLKPTTECLSTYSGQRLVVLGTLSVKVKYEAQQVVLPILVVQGSGPTLLGRDWLKNIQLNWKELSIHYTRKYRSPDEVLTKNEILFRPELGKAKGIEAKLYLDPEATPRFCKARPVPYALREKVENELQRLETKGIIEPVQMSDWAAPIVPVLKRDGSVRICGDYKLTVNQAAKLDPYPLPRIESLFSRLSAGKRFTKLDIAHAYQQIPLDEDSRNSVSINTQKGLFRYNRLPFGVHSAPTIFQRAKEGLLRYIPSTVVYIDDILITGETEEEHLHNIDTVMSRLKEEGLTLKKSKCHFLLEKVEYLGHTISEKGLQPTDDKIRAIRDAPVPQNVTQLRSFLGMVNYYGKFLKDVSSKLSPLYRLLHKKSSWKWGSEETRVFDLVKKQLIKAPVLVHYDPTKPISLAADASPYGVGAVLSLVMEDGSEMPIAYASRTLNVVEKRYSQLDKEAAAIMFGVKRFHQYLYGRKFSIVSYHKPLQYLLNENKAVPAMASARLQRWALTLSAYHHTISCRPGEKIANSDGLSRLPLPKQYRFRTK